MPADHCIDASDLPGLFAELVACWQERRAQPRDLLNGREGVVLVGAGKVGQEFLDALRASQTTVFAFADNNRGKWGQTVCGVTVLSPDDAVRRYARRAVFIVTIGRVGTAAAAITKQFLALGADAVLHFSEAIQLVPRIWPGFFAAPDAFTDADRDRCVAAYRLFQDAPSRDLFVAHLRWRTTLDAAALLTPEYDNQYFPPEIIAPRHCATFVDIGAYTGDTLIALSEFAGRSLRAYYGFEPDPRNYERPAAQAAAIPARDRHAETVPGDGDRPLRQVISFAGDGLATSQVDPGGRERVECEPLDSVGVQRPTYVKIDVEGAEDDVLTGAAETLRRWKPTVAIATYHRPKDLFDLPLRLARNAPDYQFHLRSHGDAGIDLVCYAVREPSTA